MAAMGFTAFSQLPYSWVSNTDPGWSTSTGPLVWRPGCAAVTTNCSGQYGNNLNSSYISPSINATCGDATTITVTFTAYGNTESGHDFLYFEYSLNNAATWINPYGAGVGLSGSFGSSPGTTISPIILNATSNIRFRFTFISDGSGNTSGVKITDFDVACNIVLPVETASFTAKKVGNENQLNWVTLSERNNDYFDIEWSVDPEAAFWTSISKVSAYGTGNSDVQQNYSTVHANPACGKMNYYRLTQVDEDGTRRIFDELTVVDNSAKENCLKEIVNLLGQKVDENTPGLVIYVYEDGRKVKKYQ